MPRKQPQLAKLTRPRLHKAVARERLFAVLDEARKHKPAICVVGPPGAGKTTLVASWLDARAIKGIWYQVDPGDADLATFFYYLGEAAKPYFRKGQRPLPLLTAEYLQDVEGFSRRFFRELFSRLPEGATLVLDNYQEVASDSAFHEFVARSVEEVPNGMTLVVVSRRDPPDAYARLVASEGVAFVDWEALQLTLEETRLIARTTGLVQQPDEIERLHSQCGGWAAGLTLVLDGYRKKEERLRDVPAGREGIFGYFAAQILDRVSPDTRRFLMLTSFLPTVQVSIAEALTGERACEAILEDLYRRHLFTHRRPGTEPTYWYHALFQIFLQEKAREYLGAEELGRILPRAARLFDERGQTDDAVALYRRTQDWKALREIILGAAPLLISQGRSHTLREWIEALPPDHFAASPWFCYWLGQTLMAEDQKLARVRFEAAYSGFTQAQDAQGSVLAACAVIDSVYFEWSDFRTLARWIDAIEGLLERSPKFESAELEIKVYSSLLVAILYGQPRHARLFACVDRVRELLDKDMDINQKVNAATFLLTYCVLSLDLQRGKEAIAKVGHLVDKPDVTPLNKGWWLLRLGWFMHRVVVDNDRALSAVEASASIAEQHGLGGMRSPKLLTMSYRMAILFGIGDVRSARELLDEITAIMDPMRPMDKWHESEMEGHYYLATGQATEVLRTTSVRLASAREAGMPYIEAQALYQEAVARALLGDMAEVDRATHCVNASVEGTWFAWYQEDSPFLQSYALFKSGRRSDALALLAAALDRAREIAYPFPNTAYFPGFALLFYEALNADMEVGYVEDLVRRHRVPPPAAENERWPWLLRVRTLGRFEVIREGRKIEFVGKVPKKPLTLLKAIIAFGGRRVPEERLTDALWPDEDADAAKKSLDVTVLRLRKLLGDNELVSVTDESISLNPQFCWTDAWSFERHAEKAESATGEEALGEMAAALALYAGNFLPADMSEPWALKARERLRSRFVHMVELVGKAYESSGRWDRAIDCYRRGLEADDLVEQFYQGLMRCYRAQGLNAEAMSAYRRLRQTLSVVLGIAPSDASQALARTLQQEKPARFESP